MKILMISTDKSILKESSQARKRMIDYGGLAEELHIVVFSRRKSQISGLSSQISFNVFLYSTDSHNRWLYIFDAYRISKKIFKSKFLITCQDPFETGFCGWLMAKRFKMPFQLQIHADFLGHYFWRESFLNKIGVLLAKFLIKRADCLRVVSERIKKSLMANGYSPNPIVVLPIFVDVKKIQAMPIKKNLRQKYPQFDFIILIVSRLSKEKNIHLAIKAVAEVVKKYPKTGLVIAGDGPELKNLKTITQNLNLDKQIIFEGWVGFEELISYYKTADLFLLTSNYEGYGMAVIEAMAAGLPVVMTDVGLAGEVLINGKEGLIAPVGDVQKLTRAILSLMENKELRGLLIANALEKVRQLPVKEEYLNNYKNLLERCL